MRPIDQSIHRVRAFAASQGWTKTRLAREAKINDTTLRDFDEPSWNPTARTLRQLEEIIPPDYDAAAVGDRTPSNERALS